MPENEQHPDNMKREQKEQKPLVATELWFRMEEKEALERGLIKTTVRAGDRTLEGSDPKGGYEAGRLVKLRIFNGKDLEAWEKDVVIEAVEKKNFRDLLPQDFEETRKDFSRDDNLAKLESFYGQTFGEDDVSTVVRFEYLDRMKSAADLLQTKILRRAEEPKDNPEDIDAATYTIPLIEHDYPAKTPVMWNAAYHAFGLEEKNFMAVGDPANAKQILDILRKDEKYLGGGAGVGFKDEVFDHLDEIDEEAAAIGSVNFILKTSEGKLKGFNTDGVGYAESLEALLEKRDDELRGKKVVLLGAGGTGNAIAFALAKRGVNLVILNRTVEKAEALAQRIREFVGVDEEDVRFGGEELIAEEVSDADVVLNVSTKGAAGQLEAYSPLARALLPPTIEHIQENIAQAKLVLSRIPRQAIISDIVLRKEQTPFLEQSKEAGFETLDGVPMVINQGVEAFWLLHGKELENKGITKDHVAEVMREAAQSK